MTKTKTINCNYSVGRFGLFITYFQSGNYTNLQKGIHETTEYLEAFLRNLLLNEKNELHNRNLHISGFLNEEKWTLGMQKWILRVQKWTFETEKWILKVYFPKKVEISR